jgi:hypothetical protein
MEQIGRFHCAGFGDAQELLENQVFSPGFRPSE